MNENTVHGQYTVLGKDATQKCCQLSCLGTGVTVLCYNPHVTVNVSSVEGGPDR